ncbi:MAG: hypothetical protein QXG98_05030 [Candidatus Micrarchaeia archaeon]
MAKTVCIICGRQRSGAPVADDAVIRTIRWLKRRLGVLQGNKLVVCRDDMEEHQRRRQRFEKHLIQYGAIFFVLAIAMLVLSGSLLGMLIIVVMAAFILALVIVVDYTPLVKKAGRG